MIRPAVGDCDPEELTTSTLRARPLSVRIDVALILSTLPSPTCAFVTLCGLSVREACALTFDCAPDGVSAPIIAGVIGSGPPEAWREAWDSAVCWACSAF